MENASPTRYNLDIYSEENKENLVYLESAFSYRDNSQSKTVYHQVNLCFNDDPSLKQNYFFAGNAFFYDEWTSFLSEIKIRNKAEKSYDFAIIPLTEVNSKDAKANYIFNYDMTLFKSYDGKPIKAFRNQLNDQCEVYVGDFFISR